jgi:hypothetical protein
MAMSLSSNINLPFDLASLLLARLRDGFFKASVFEPSGWAIALETAGPEDGVGVSAYAYDGFGRWQTIGLEEPKRPRFDILEQWVAQTYQEIGSWRELLIQIVWSNDEANAHFEFEFDEDANRWVHADETDRFLGDMVRPNGLPMPLKPGPHF